MCLSERSHLQMSVQLCLCGMGVYGNSQGLQCSKGLQIPLPPWAVDVMATTAPALIEEKSRDRVSGTQPVVLVCKVEVDFIAL